MTSNLHNLDWLCLQEGRMNISETSLACGYNNLSYFNRQFHRYAGMCAREYLSHIREK